jgi:hypothetical protein
MILVVPSEELKEITSIQYTKCNLGIFSIILQKYFRTIGGLLDSLATQHERGRENVAKMPIHGSQV